MATDIRVNLNSVPECVRDNLAEATLDAVKAFMEKNGGADYLNRRIAEKKERRKSSEKVQNR